MKDNTVMDTSVKTSISAEEKTKLINEMMNLLEEYDYHPTENGCAEIVEEWMEQKGWLIELMKKHPNYIENKYMIVFDSSYERKQDFNTKTVFCNWAQMKAGEIILQPFKIGPFSSIELEKILDNLSSRIFYCEWLHKDKDRYGFPLSSLEEDHKRLMSYKDRYAKKFLEESKTIACCNGHFYYRESVDRYKGFVEIIDNLRYIDNQFIASYTADSFNHVCPALKAREGQKLSKVVNKLCKLYGIDKDPEYNKKFAKFSDAVNPLSITRYTVISCNPIDYFTMSFGNSWASCHTIDKKNVRDASNSYEGMYSGGTLSYMLDNSSVVFYTVDKHYNGTNYELQDKINRNMFHLGRDKIIQGRVYPQDNDGANSLYKQIREIVQKVFADCLGVPNLWINKKGINECCKVTRTEGVHYPDYLRYDNCNVSYLKDQDNSIDVEYIAIGAEQICPCCGEYHETQDCIECEDCRDGEKVRCAVCGELIDEEEAIYIDNEPYCFSHCYYCDECEEFHVGEPFGEVLDHHGYPYRFCHDGYCNNGNITYCDECEEFFFRDDEDAILAEDGKEFCCENCAREAGYRQTANGRWYDIEDLMYCDECAEYVLYEDWNEERQMCNCCVHNEEERESNEARIA